MQNEDSETELLLESLLRYWDEKSVKYKQDSTLHTQALSSSRKGPSTYTLSVNLYNSNLLQ